MPRTARTAPAPDRPGGPSGLLQQIDAAFAELVSGSEPLGIYGGEVTGLPARWIPLDELRSMLLHPSTRYQTRDETMALLVLRARNGGEDWKVGLLGVLVPGLAAVAGRAARGYPGDFEDVVAEAVSGLLDAAARVDLAEGRVASRLLGVAFTRAWAMVRHERRRRRWEHAAATQIDSQGHGDPAAGASVGRDHDPADVLRLAVACGVLTAAEARLIARTRLDGIPLNEVATCLRITHATVRQRRSRAERRLVRWIAQLDGDGAAPALGCLSRAELAGGL